MTSRVLPGARASRIALSLVIVGVLLTGGIASGAAPLRSEPPQQRTTSPTDRTDGQRPTDRADVGPSDTRAEDDDPMADLQVSRAEDPARTIVEDGTGAWVATFTDDARTVTLAGPQRRFDEATATHGVTSDTWVRVLEEPFRGDVDGRWLEEARRDTSPDVLETAMAFTEGAPDVTDEEGLLRSAEAAYGPLRDGERPVGSDWNDFQGVSHTYGTRTDRPEEDRYRSLDCSGYVRMIYGVTFGVPMGLRPDGGTSLPRRSMEQAAAAPGVVLHEDRGEQLTDLDALAPGDLVFFDAPSDDDGTIDHVGIYLGRDDADSQRFVHSRRSSNGPTMGGDAHGRSVVDGDGFFAEGLRATRRL